jgi:beta-N-acetylhexosaminidase
MAHLIVGINSLTLTPQERNVLVDPRIAGVILFSRNYQDKPQLQALTQALHTLKRKAPLDIYVDQEGGRVQRFRKDFTALPPAFDLSIENAQHTGHLMATELKAVGVDFSFAPVVDLNKNSTVIGNRAFGRTPLEVINKVEPYLAGMKRAGMPGILKHFPGHGTAIPDTHLEVAQDLRSFAEISAEDLLPFAHFSKQGIFGIMAAHVIYPAIDPLPASLSRYWLVTVLREQLGFSGRIYSDDLGMEALAAYGTPLERVQATFAAGADYALLCNDFSAVIDTLEGLT